MPHKAEHQVIQYNTITYKAIHEVHGTLLQKNTGQDTVMQHTTCREVIE